MAEEQNVDTVQQQSEAAVENQQQKTGFDPFKEESWEQNPVNADKKENLQQQENQEPNSQDEEFEEEILEPDVWLKNEFGFENTDAAKKEIEELRKLRESAVTKEEIKFANEQSQKFFELLKEGKEDDVYNYLSEKKKLEKLVSSDVDKKTAEEIIKLSIYQKNKELTPEEVDFLFEKKYQIPEKPEPQIDEDDDDYEKRVQKWQKQVQAVEKEMIIEAKMAKPELAKLKTELVLPDIKKDNVPQQQSQEDLEKINKARENYLKKLETDYKSFNGYSTKFKDEDVELDLTYQVDDNEKSALKNEFENFDLEGFVLSRWFKEDGEPNIQQMMDDVYLLKNKEKVISKFVNDAAQKRLAHHIKKTANIKIDSPQNSKAFNPQGNMSDLEKQIEFIWKNS